MLLTEQSPEIFPKRNGCFFISEYFAWNWYIFAALANKKMLLPLKCKLKKNFLFGLQKIIECRASTVNVV